MTTENTKFCVSCLVHQETNLGVYFKLPVFFRNLYVGIYRQVMKLTTFFKTQYHRGTESSNRQQLYTFLSHMKNLSRAKAFSSFQAPHWAALGAKLTALEFFMRRRRWQASTNILGKYQKVRNLSV